MKYFTLILITLLVYTKEVFSQVVTAGDCNLAINICSNAGFQIDPNGTGSVYELSSPGGSTGPGGSAISNPGTNPASANLGCLLSGELNSTWMVINIQTSGVLQFSFGAGGAQAGFYDWAMWSYAGPATCNQIANVGQAPVRCNWNGVSTGGTGLANPLPAGGNATNYEPPLNVTCGQRYIICFSNYSAAATNVPLNFFGTAGVSCAPIPNPISVNSATICGSQVANLTATGAAGNTYTWTPGGSTGPTLNVSPAVTTTYTVSASGGCGSQVGTQTTVVNVTSGPNSSITSVVNSTAGGGTDPTPSIQCLSPNSFNFNAPAAAGTHSWNFGGGGATPATSSAISPTGIVYSTPGTYTVTHSVSNAGCVSTSSTVVTITAPPTAIINSVPTCANTNSAAVVASGGTPGYTYNWLPTGGTSASASGLALGNYSVTVTDANGCVVTRTITVATNPKPSATLSFTNPNCGLNNGVVVITNTSPGAPPQTVTSFASSLGTVSGQTVTGLGAGTPVITLTNNFGCTFTVSATLINSSGPTDVVLTPNNIICGIGTGSITIGAVTGGVAPYTYNVNGGAFSGTPPITGLASGTYTIGVRDVNGCIFTKTVTISVTTGPTAIAGTTTPAGCSATNGTYNITGVTGGTPAYSFSVDAVATSSLTSNLAPGTHTVSVRDANGCTFNTTFVVGGTTGPTSATVITTNASCGATNGSATVTAVTGGSLPYQYSFNGGAFSAVNNISGLSAGIHTVIVRDASTCTLVVVYNILNTGSPTASVTNSINVSCFGWSNGSFTVTPVGGTPPYTYTLTAPFQTNGTGFFTGLPQGSYNITVRDQVGCITTTSVSLTQPTAVSLTTSSIPVRCFGTATGTINVVGAGGTPVYSYNLNGGTYQASSTFANVFSGIFSIGIMDANGCTATQTVTVAQPSALNIAVSSQNANCTTANGVASSTITGGTGLITYSWTPTGGAAATSNSVAAGNYTIIGTDANGCTISSPVVVGLNPGGTATITSITNVNCNGACNGSMTAGMIGGSAPFTYSWSPGGQTNSTATNLCPGTYTCEITDFYGCKSTASGIISQPPVLNAIMNSNNVKCFGTPTGTVTAAGTGGTLPYTYLWPQLPSTLSSVSNVPIGTYTCIITDLNGCSITQTISVTQPSAIVLTSSVTPANCNLANGSATVTISGGSAPYSQIWSVTGSTTTVQTGVAAGTYTINVQDANTCTVALSATIPNLAGPTISITSQTNVSCFSGNNGVATASASSGSGPYIYSWSNGPTSPTATNLTAGLYTVSATDQAGCVASTSVNITQPAALTVTIVPTNPKCFGSSDGSGLAAAAGGTAPYGYVWTSTGGTNPSSNPLPAGNYGLTVTDANGCIVTSSMSLTNPLAMAASITATNVTCFGQTNGIAVASSTNGNGVVSYFWTGTPSPVSSQTLSGVGAGSYTLLATDQNSCTASAQITITQPTQVTANITSTGSVTCNGGNNGFAVVTPVGGTGAFSYVWSPSGGSTANANTLTAGVYFVTVSDANLCSATATATILQPTPLATTLTTTNPTCNGVCDGTANIAFLGGAGATTFLWQPGLQSGNTVNNLCAGNHTVTITSNGSCLTTLTFTLTEPAALTAVASATNSNCGQANGRTCVVIAGGTSPYSSLWSNGVTTLCNNNVIAGPYTYTVTDANGCTAVAIGNINDIAGPIVSITASTPVNCFGGSDGTATATITGGVSPYSISWTGAQSGPNTTTNPINFGAGAHAINVSDAAGCIGTASVNITEPTQLVSAIGSFTNVTCNGLSNGGATILANGGTTPYTYAWSPSGQTSSVLINVGANTYTGTVTDANGCLTSQQVIISQPSAIVMAASGFTNVTCFGANNGQISTTVQGGSPGYTYVWTPAVIPPGGFISGLAPGGYSLQVTDANGCSINANFTITEPSVLTSTYTALPATCGLINGSATLTLGGGTPNYSVVWNIPGTPTGISASNMSPGTWTANITDSKGCTTAQAVTIANPPVPVINGFVTNQPTCFGLANGDITINYSSGVAPYTIAWSNPISQTLTTSAFTSSVSGVSAGAYTATLTDSYGCSTSQPVAVSQPNMLVLIPSPDVTICFGQSTQLNAAGSCGTPAYTYSWTPNTLVGGGPHTVNPTTTTSYIVSLVDANGCSRPPQIITVSVSAPLAALGTSTTICHNEPVVLTPNITSVGNGGPYNYNWTPAAGNTSSISVVGNAPTIAVTNTYAVSVSDGCTVPNATAIFTVIVNPLPIINFVATPTIGCAPLTLTLTGISNGANDTYTWYDVGNGIQGNNSVITLNDAGLYTLSLFVTNPLTGCRADLRKTDYIEVFPQPIASFYAVPPLQTILNPNFDFVNTSQGATSYYWDFGDPAALNGTNNSTAVNPSHGYSYVGEYKVNLVATSDKGCVDIAYILVEVAPDFALYIPNAFTPDGNNVNDVFQPMGVGIDEENYRMDIFDRWGENIFTSNNFRKGWDGSVKGSSKTAPQGVYTYKLMVKDTQGNKHPYVGHVTVIRENQ
jgi:gliding motility-associated-like protein